jgi:hypothetical protein
MPVGGVESVSPISKGIPEARPVSAIEESPQAGAAAESISAPVSEKGVEVSISPEARSLAAAAEENTPREEPMPKADLELTNTLGKMDLAQQEFTAPIETTEPQTRTTSPEVIAQAALSA